MKIKQLHIQNFRNIIRATFEFSDHHNFICGNNGAGKTSFIESIYYLVRTRSFRSSLHNNIVVRNGDDRPLLLSRFISDNNFIYRIGLSVFNNRLRVNVNNEPAYCLSYINHLIPLQIFHSDTTQQFFTERDFRRRFLDWGVFHVKHEFSDLWKKYVHILKQRNIALKTKNIKLIKSFDSELIKISEIIDTFRKDYFLKFIGMMSLLNLCARPELISISYYRGWPDEQSFESLINSKIYNDIKYGFTQFGPHRADLIFSLNGMPTNKMGLSTSEKKIYLFKLFLAQLELHHQTSNEGGIFLFDDPFSDLSINNQFFLLNLLSTINCQTFITLFDQSILCDWSEPIKLFHVEQGIFIEKN